MLGACGVCSAAWSTPVLATSTSVNLPTGIVKASRSFASIQRAWGWRVPRSLFPVSLLYLKFSSAPFPPPGKREALLSFSTLPFLILWSPARPLSSVQNYLQSPTWRARPLQGPGRGASVSRPSKCALPSANGPLPFALQDVVGRAGVCEPEFRSRSAWELPDAEVSGKSS